MGWILREREGGGRGLFIEEEGMMMGYRDLRKSVGKKTPHIHSFIPMYNTYIRYAYSEGCLI